MPGFEPPEIVNAKEADLEGDFRQVATKSMAT
jgi:hypothetical protein